MFKKSILVLIVAVLAVLAYGTLSTGAWFTDQATSSQANVSTGDFDLSIEESGTFVVTDLEPGAGYEDVGTFCVSNTGDYDMKFRGWITEVGDAEILKDHLLVRAVLNPVAIPEKQYGPTNTEMFTDIPLTWLLGPNDYIITGLGAAAFPPEYKACYQVQVKLSAAAGNSYESKTLTAKLYIEGTQFINSGWGQ